MSRPGRFGYRGHGGRPTVHVVPAGIVTPDVGIVVPVDEAAEPLLDTLTAVAALIPAPNGFVASDPVTPSDVDVPGRLGEVVIGELADPSEDAVLLGVDMLELIDDEEDESDDVDTVGVNSSEIPLLPSTEPV